MIPHDVILMSCSVIPVFRRAFPPPLLRHISGNLRHVVSSYPVSYNGKDNVFF